MRGSSGCEMLRQRRSSPLVGQCSSPRRRMACSARELLYSAAQRSAARELCRPRGSDHRSSENQLHPQKLEDTEAKSLVGDELARGKSGIVGESAGI